MKKFLSELEEILVAVLLFVMAYLALKGIPQLDPRSGVDDLGFLSGLIQSAASVIFVFFFARYYRRRYTHSSDADRKVNADAVRASYPLVFYWTEKLHQLAIVLIILSCFRR